jgi:hypothetical protein
VSSASPDELGTASRNAASCMRLLARSISSVNFRKASGAAKSATFIYALYPARRWQLQSARPGFAQT